MIATLSTGHNDASDWLLLAAVVLFALAAVLYASTSTSRPPWFTAPVALALGLAGFALGAFVL